MIIVKVIKKVGFVLLLPLALFIVGCKNDGYNSSTQTQTAKINPAYIKEYSTVGVTHPTMQPYVVSNIRYIPVYVPKGYKEVGIASWYGPNFNGKLTSNGEVYDMHDYTVAHKTLPINTVVRITNSKSRKSIIARVNDRGPFIGNRIVDLSKKIAIELGTFNKGLGKVELEVLGFYEHSLGNTATLNKDVYIQLAAYNTYSNAKVAKDKYNIKYSNVVVKKSIVDRKTIYKVLIDGFKNRAEASRFLSLNLNKNTAFLYIE